MEVVALLLTHAKIEDAALVLLEPLAAGCLVSIFFPLAASHWESTLQPEHADAFRRRVFRILLGWSAFVVCVVPAGLIVGLIVEHFGHGP